MLTEMKNLKAETGAERRWFADEYFDLFVWSDHNGWSAFELCYDKAGDERALVWRQGQGFSRVRIDQGEDNPSKNNTPIWTKDSGALRLNDIIERFELAAGGLEPALYDFVRVKLGQCPRS